jgi:hypothetical protein
MFRESRQEFVKAWDEIWEPRFRWRRARLVEVAAVFDEHLEQVALAKHQDMV